MRIDEQLAVKNLEFDEERHIYSYNGIKVPSVTQIMKPLSSDAYGSIPKATLDKAAERGTRVHNAIEIFTNYGFEDASDDAIPFFEAFKDWYNLRKPEVLATELKLFHSSYIYAGACDLLCEIDGVPTLVDYKTTSTVQDKLCGVQLEAYSRALADMGFKVQNKMILHLSKDGKWNEHSFAANDMMRWKVFTSCLAIRDYLEN